MRYVKLIVVVVLIVSLFGNFILWRRDARNRLKLRVNDKVTTQRMYHDWLETYYGNNSLKDMLVHDLVMDAAVKAGWKRPDKEIDEAIEQAQERDPRVAIQFRMQPWQKLPQVMQMEMASALNYLRTKDVKATDDELRDFFNTYKGAWDKQDLIYTKTMIAKDEANAQRTKELMEKVKDLKTIQQQTQPNAWCMGVDGTWAIPTKFGTAHIPSKTNPFARMRPTSGEAPGSVIIIRNLRTGAGVIPFAVIRLEKIVDGKKATFEEIKDKVAMAFKLTRATPAQETLRKLFDSANIETDPPGLKSELEKAIFPDKKS